MTELKNTTPELLTLVTVAAIARAELASKKEAVKIAKENLAKTPEAIWLAGFEADMKQLKEAEAKATQAVKGATESRYKLTKIKQFDWGTINNKTTLAYDQEPVIKKLIELGAYDLLKVNTGKEFNALAKTSIMSSVITIGTIQVLKMDTNIGDFCPQEDEG